MVWYNIKSDSVFRGKIYIKLVQKKVIRKYKKCFKAIEDRVRMLSSEETIDKILDEDKLRNSK